MKTGIFRFRNIYYTNQSENVPSTCDPNFQKIGENRKKKASEACPYNFLIHLPLAYYIYFFILYISSCKYIDLCIKVIIFDARISSGIVALRTQQWQFLRGEAVIVFSFELQFVMCLMMVL